MHDKGPRPGVGAAPDPLNPEIQAGHLHRPPLVPRRATFVLSHIRLAVECRVSVDGGGGAQWHAAGMAADGLTLALEAYQRAQDELVEARNRLARAIAGAAMSGMTKDEIVEATGYPADLVLRICQDAGISPS
jgi:hypothetical protein